MAAYRFELQSVLDHRVRVEQQRQRELAAVAAEVAGLEQRLRDLDEQAREATDDLRRRHLHGRVDVTVLSAHRRFQFAAQRKAMDLAEAIAAASRRRDEARRLLVDASTQRKVLEKLRERRQAAWQAQISRRENAELDEIAMRLATGQGHA